MTSPSEFCVCVTGGRDFADRDAVWGKLDELRAGHQGHFIVLHGANPNGADRWAEEWYERTRPRASREKIPANWDLFGRSAGTMRNVQLVDRLRTYRGLGVRVLVVGFPGPASKGTWDMIRRVNEAGLPHMWLTANGWKENL